jgi:tetratricopeptide (TPR) repeat protein
MANEIFNYHRRIDNLHIFVDGSNAGFINELKKCFGESSRWTITKGSKINPNVHKVIPVNFATEHKHMLYKTYDLVSKRKIAINKKFDKLLTSMRTATAEDFHLDKDNTVNNDHLDAFRLGLKPFKGQTLMSLERYQEAIECFNLVLDKDPTNFDTSRLISCY